VARAALAVVRVAVPAALALVVTLAAGQVVTPVELAAPAVEALSPQMSLLIYGFTIVTRTSLLKTGYMRITEAVLAILAVHRLTNT